MQWYRFKSGPFSDVRETGGSSVEIGLSKPFVDHGTYDGGSARIVALRISESMWRDWVLGVIDSGGRIWLVGAGYETPLDALSGMHEYLTERNIV